MDGPHDPGARMTFGSVSVEPVEPDELRDSWP
jgi:hypothetical protein